MRGAALPILETALLEEPSVIWRKKAGRFVAAPQSPNRGIELTGISGQMSSSEEGRIDVARAFLSVHPEDHDYE